MDFIDTAIRATPTAIASAAEGGKTGVVEILGDGDVTVRSTGALGRQLLSIATTASAHNALGISSAAATILSGATTDGVAVVTASGASALALALPTATATLPGVIEIATSAEASARTSGKVPDASTMGSHPGIAKAWAQFNGSAQASVRRSFNVSSITRTGSGLYSVVFTDPMPSAHYMISFDNFGQNHGGRLDVAASAGGLNINYRITTNNSATDSPFCGFVVY